MMKMWPSVIFFSVLNLTRPGIEPTTFRNRSY